MGGHSNISIEEVDEKLKLGSPPSKVPAIIAWIVVIFFWVSGTGIAIYYIILNFNLVVSILALLGVGIQAISNYSSLIITYVLIMLAVVLAAIIFLLLMIRKFAREVLLIIILLAIGFYFVLGVIMLLVRSIAGVLPIVIGGVLLLIFLKYRRRISLLGSLMELSANTIIQEKGTISANIIASILGSYTFVTVSITSFFIYNYVAKFNLPDWIDVLIGFAVFLLGLWATTFIVTLFNATIVGITHDWYRSPHVDVASFRKGLKRALTVQGGIAVYAFVMSVLRVLIEYAKQRGGIARGIVVAILRITEEIVRFLTFYIIPAMVIRVVGFKDGLKDSVHKLRDLLIETIVTRFAFGFVMFVFAFIYTIVLGAIGYVIGAYIITPIFLAGISPVLVGVVSGVIYMIVGIVPASIIFSTLSVVLTTLIYEFGLDIEFAQKGETLPRRLPREVETEFLKILEERGLKVQL